MKKWITLVCISLLATGCLPQNKEDYSILRFGYEPDGNIYQLAAKKKILVPKIVEGLRNSQYLVFTCPVDGLQCESEFGSQRCQCPKQDRINCRYFEIFELGVATNLFDLRCVVTRWFQTNREFQIIANDKNGATVDRSPILSASILDAEGPSDAAPIAPPPPAEEEAAEGNDAVEAPLDAAPIAEEEDNAGFVDGVEHEAIFDPNKGLLDKVSGDDVDAIEGENAGSGGDSGWFGCSFYGDDADSRIEFMILLGLVGLVILQSRKVD